MGLKWGNPYKQDEDRTARWGMVVVKLAMLYFGIHGLVWLVRGCSVATG